MEESRLLAWWIYHYVDSMPNNGPDEYHQAILQFKKMKPSQVINELKTEYETFLEEFTDELEEQ